MLLSCDYSGVQVDVAVPGRPPGIWLILAAGGCKVMCTAVPWLEDVEQCQLALSHPDPISQFFKLPSERLWSGCVVAQLGLTEPL
jgi:hypothetical protein